MGIFRQPGPLGAQSSGLFCFRRPFDLPWQRFDEFDGFTPGALGTNGDQGVEAMTDATESAEDANELKILRETYGGVADVDGRPYAWLAKVGTGKHKKEKWEYDVAGYVADRAVFFGSTAAYRAYRDAGVTELDAKKTRLRKALEPPLKDRKRLLHWQDAQNVFWAWVRMAYEKHPDVPDDADIPKLATAGMSPELEKALAKVKADYKGPWKPPGGFNARPMKLDGRYRLGTLSDHALGKACDVDDHRNAQIKAEKWGHVLALTGKSLDHVTRKSKWKKAPKELHDAIVEINDAFVDKVDEAVEQADKAAADRAAAAKAAAEKAAKEGHPAPAAPPPKGDSLKAAIAADQKLKNVGEEFITRWRKGFFTLPWELVKAFHDEGFTWGATFSSPDLHHFEL